MSNKQKVTQPRKCYEHGQRIVWLAAYRSSGVKVWLSFSWLDSTPGLLCHWCHLSSPRRISSTSPCACLKWRGRNGGKEWHTEAEESQDFLSLQSFHKKPAYHFWMQVHNADHSWLLDKCQARACCFAHTLWAAEHHRNWDEWFGVERMGVMSLAFFISPQEKSLHVFHFADLTQWIVPMSTQAKLCIWQTMLSVWMLWKPWPLRLCLLAQDTWNRWYRNQEIVKRCEKTKIQNKKTANMKCTVYKCNVTHRPFLNALRRFFSASSLFKDGQRGVQRRGAARFPRWRGQPQAALAVGSLAPRESGAGASGRGPALLGASGWKKRVFFEGWTLGIPDSW